MHVAVIGAGIIGVTTAYELAADGHRVTVFERRGTVAAEASFAHAGIVSPAGVAPWAGAGPATKRPFNRDARLRIRGLDVATARWLWQARRARRDPAAEDQRAGLQGLARQSHERLRELTQTLQLDYERSDGCLSLLRTEGELAAARTELAWLEAQGTRVEVLDAAGCRALEPGLSPDTPLAGGVWRPSDEVGNCRQFAHLLRQAAERLGVRFRFHTTVQGLEAGHEPQVTSLHAPPADPAQGEWPDTVALADGPRSRPFDAVVVCAALGAQALLRPHAVRLPLQAVHGYSITAPLRRNDLHPDMGPRSALRDERHGVSISRIGARVRVAGGCEVGGAPDRLVPDALETLHAVLHDWFPGVVQVEQAQRWKGARPMLPDGRPVLGPSGAPGLWLNLGHGSNGWTLACGAARWLADAIAGRPPAVAVGGLGIERLAASR